MPTESVFRNALYFFYDLGVYDVLLPFFLVFCIVFAILDKTRVLGTETVDGKPVPKKSLNAMVAFVMGFLVVASAKLVALINEAMSNVVVLLLIIIFFLLLVGSFHAEGADFYLQKKWKSFFMFLAFAGIALIFLHAVKTPDGGNWLYWIWYYLYYRWDSTVIGSLILLAVLVGAIFLATMREKPSDSGSHGESSAASKDHH
ncbi:hypothetical protein HZB01_04420 [Candidatus Woesearchaeota archaeon]|nr:hypothetical protein [Candidatus Woesearchaeota archaeon]